MIIFLLIVILIFVIIILNRQHKKFLDLELEFRKLTFKIDDLKSDLEKNLSQKTVLDKQPISEIKAQEVKAVIEEVEQLTISEEMQNDDAKIEEIIVLVQENNPNDAEIVPQNIEPLKEQNKIESQVAFSENSIPVEDKSTTFKQSYQPKKSWFESFKEKNPDLEKFIGENLISKIGILILVLGISFFVKYAIDRDWINEPARVGIGILAGVIVMGVAHRLRKDFKAFSSVFVAGAVSIFYFTIGIAFHDYHLFNQTVAFIIMVVITLFSAFISLSYNRKELAILTLIGGFAVPFMVSTGSGNYQVLFTYIAILNVGMLIISYFKKWHVVTLLAFIFSAIIYGSWFTIEFNAGKLPYFGAFVYATLMYMIFSVAIVINNVRNKGAFTKIEYLMMLGNTFFYFGIGATVFRNWHEELKGIFTLTLALYNLLFAVILYRKFGIKKDAIYFLLGLTLTFVTLTIPFQFNGNYITLFWACEAVLLLWMSQKSKISTFKIGSIIVQVLMIVSLIIDWTQAYSGWYSFDLDPLFNKIFITGLVAIVSFIATYFLLCNETEATKFYFLTIPVKPYRKIALIAAIVFGYFVGFFEVVYQVNQYFTNIASTTSYVAVYHYVFTSILVYFLFKNKNHINNIIALIVSCLNILLYILIFHKLTSNEISNNLYFNYESNSAFIGHYVIAISVLYCLYALFKNRTEANLAILLNAKFSLWIFVFCFTFILSNEIMVHTLFYSAEQVKILALADTSSAIANVTDVSFYSQQLSYDSELMVVKKRVIKVGFPILWGLLSFVFLIVGIKKQLKQLRIIALSLLGITIIKLFIFDINVSGPGRIVAFILLGILILIISFVYQKLNKKAAEESKNKHHEENY